jgi:hypothetical protein
MEAASLSTSHPHPTGLFIACIHGKPGLLGLAVGGFLERGEEEKRPCLRKPGSGGTGLVPGSHWPSIGANCMPMGYNLVESDRVLL